VRARAWCRADLAGGTLDIWPLGLLHRKASTVNVALALEVRVELRPAKDTYCVRQGETTITAATRDELRANPGSALCGWVADALDLPPIEIEIFSASPRGAGLGASSALTMALLAAGEAFQNRTPSEPADRVALARDLEAAMMAYPTGVQDHYPALLGGALEISYRAGGEEVQRLKTDLDALGDSLLVLYTGRSHFSAGQNWKIVRRALDGDAEIHELLSGIAEVASEMALAITACDYESAGKLMTREWSLRRQLADGISTPEIEHLLAVADSMGSWGGKACGAGGGGCIALLAPPTAMEGLKERLRTEDCLLLDSRCASEPLNVWQSTP